MSVNDPIGDMLTRIRNAQMMKHQYVLVPSSNIKRAIAAILSEEGYIEKYEEIEAQPQSNLRLWLKYDKERKPVITNLRRISKPGRRIYKGKEEIPWVLSGVGIAILSTSRGLMTDRQARRHGVGGEVLCYVW